MSGVTGEKANSTSWVGVVFCWWLQMSVHRTRVVMTCYCEMKSSCSSWWLPCSSAFSSSLTSLATADEDGSTWAWMKYQRLACTACRDEFLIAAGLKVKVDKISQWKNHWFQFYLMWFFVYRDNDFLLLLSAAYQDHFNHVENLLQLSTSFLVPSQIVTPERRQVKLKNSWLK